jgi:hypothetical protein
MFVLCLPNPRHTGYYIVRNFINKNIIIINNTNTIVKNAIFEMVYESFNALLLASNPSIGFTER